MIVRVLKTLDCVVKSKGFKSKAAKHETRTFLTTRVKRYLKGSCFTGEFRNGGFNPYPSWRRGTWEDQLFTDQYLREPNFKHDLPYNRWRTNRSYFNDPGNSDGKRIT